ncbi:MAG: cell division protein ZapA [Gammaproteobacteria bacterium]
MSQSNKPVSIMILDKEYLISCEEEEREQLLTAAEYLNDKLDELKKSGKVIGSERIAIMTALNITHEYLAYKRENNDYTDTMDSAIKRLRNKIDGVLVKDRPLAI